MNLSFNESISFCENNVESLQQLSQNTTLIICPSFVALAPITAFLKSSAILVGAQNCSAYESGAYTGEVSTISLAQIGVTHCIVGHSEQRMYHHETTEHIIDKIKLLYKYNITPILCIGETKENFLNNQTFTTLTQQLQPILTAINHEKHPIIIAYEPIWSIGTGIIPEQEQLTNTFSWLSNLIHLNLTHKQIPLLYGGSINHQNIAMLKQIPNIDGFLIGGASTDFEEFKKIITLSH